MQLRRRAHFFKNQRRTLIQIGGDSSGRFAPQFGQSTSPGTSPEADDPRVPPATIPKIWVWDKTARSRRHWECPATPKPVIRWTAKAHFPTSAWWTIRKVSFQDRKLG